jgi:hypothetical protein
LSERGEIRGDENGKRNWRPHQERGGLLSDWHLDRLAFFAATHFYLLAMPSNLCGKNRRGEHSVDVESPMVSVFTKANPLVAIDQNQLISTLK